MTNAARLTWLTQDKRIKTKSGCSVAHFERMQYRDASKNRNGQDGAVIHMLSRCGQTPSTPATGLEKGVQHSARYSGINPKLETGDGREYTKNNIRYTGATHAALGRLSFWGEVGNHSVISSFRVGRFIIYSMKINRQSK